jgi:hypothetical protein
MEVYEKISGGEITSPNEIAQYADKLSPSTIQTFIRSLREGSLRDDLGGTGSGIGGMINDAFKNKQGKTDYYEKTQFLTIYQEQVSAAQAKKGGKLTPMEKMEIAKGLLADVYATQDKTKWLKPRYERMAAEREGFVYNSEYKDFVLYGDDNEILDFWEQRENRGKSGEGFEPLGGAPKKGINTKLFDTDKKRTNKLKQGNKQEFIEELSPKAVEISKSSGILPSIIIAQAALESGWGKSAIGSNLFGIKAGAGWKGKTRNERTTEYVNGKPVAQYAIFRDYDSLDESIADHAKLLLGSRYKKVREAKDYKEAARALKAAGYATDPNYARKLIQIIELWGLDELDAS